MNRRLVPALLVANLLVWGLIAISAAYFELIPFDALIGSQTSSHKAFISLAIPTPTEFAAPPITPITPILVDTPLPAGVGATRVPALLTPPATVQPVRDGGLIPPSAINIVLLGTDMRQPGSPNWRTDTMILVSIDQDAKTVGLLSIPRDLWVNIPGIGQQRINTADFYGEYYHLPGGGPQTVKTTIERNLGIRVHYYVRVGFDSFRTAIDTLGGIDVDVDCALQENGFSDDYGTVNLNFQPGLQHMDGVTALRYARSRYTTSDYDRGRRQRKVLLAMWDKATSLNLLPKWPDLYNQFRSSVQTDLSPTELASLAFVGSQLKLDRIKSRAIDNRTAMPWTTPAGEMVLLPQAEKIHSLLVEFFSQPSSGPDPFESERARVQVISANTTTANTATVTLRRQGFQVMDPGKAASFSPVSSIVVYNNKPDTLQRLLSTLRISAANVRMSPQANANVDLQVILGADYNACQK